jgi:hypothetical protein
MAVFTQYLIINVALFVIIAYLVIQCYKDIKEILKEILKDDNETFED